MSVATASPVLPFGMSGYHSGFPQSSRMPDGQQRRKLTIAKRPSWLGTVNGDDSSSCEDDSPPFSSSENELAGSSLIEDSSTAFSGSDDERLIPTIYRVNGLNLNRYVTKEQVVLVDHPSENRRLHAYYESDESRHPEQYPNTVLSEFLKDCDRLADFRPNERPTRSISCRSSDQESKQDEVKCLPTVQPTVERWFVLMLICISVGVRSFVSVVFGQINDIFSTYFDVEPEAVDWLTNTGSLATLFAIAGLVIFGGKVPRLRCLCLLMTGTASVGTALLTAAMTDRFYGYALGIAGQISMGLNNAIAMSISPLVAATWFPNGQVATALSAALICVGLGEALGSYIPGVLVFKTDLSTVESITSGAGEDFDLMADIEETVRFKLVTLFVIPAGISLCTFVVALSFLKERPTFPPSKAQARVRSLEQDANTAEKNDIVSISRSSLEAASAWSRRNEHLAHFRNKSFALLAFIYGVVAASGSSSITLLSSFLPYVDDQQATLDSDALSGRVTTVMWICFTAGPFVTGFILDKTGKYKETAVVTTFGLVVGSTGIPLSIFLANIPGLYVSHGLLGFFMGAAETALFEIAAETTYPAPELTFASLLNIAWVTFFVIFPVSGRWILNTLDESGVIAAAVASAVPAIFAIVAAILAAFCLKPTYKRKANNSDAEGDKFNETTPLLKTV